jgi:hypothetical protein
MDKLNLYTLSTGKNIKAIKSMAMETKQRTQECVIPINVNRLKKGVL